MEEKSWHHFSTLLENCTGTTLPRFAIDPDDPAVIQITGFNIYPREIDEALFQHPKVEFAVNVGIPDPYRGETVKAFIVLKEGQTATDREIIAFCKGKMPPTKCLKQ